MLESFLHPQPTNALTKTYHFMFDLYVAIKRRNILRNSHVDENDDEQLQQFLTPSQHSSPIRYKTTEAKSWYEQILKIATQTYILTQPIQSRNGRWNRSCRIYCLLYKRIVIVDCIKCSRNDREISSLKISQKKCVHGNHKPNRKRWQTNKHARHNGTQPIDIWEESWSLSTSLL